MDLTTIEPTIYVNQDTHQELFNGHAEFNLYDNAFRSVMYIIIFIGNFVTILCICRYKFLRQKKNVLIGSLSVADLLVGLGWFVYLSLFFLNKRDCTYAFEIFFSFDMTTRYPLYTSVFHLLVISIDKLIAVVLPLRYESLMHKKMMTMVVVVAWTAPFLLLFAKMFYAGQELFTPCAELSEFVDANYFTDLLLYCSIVTTMIGIYGVIWREARQQSKRIAAMENIASTRGNRKITTKANKCVVIILGSFSLLYLPYELSNILAASRIASPVVNYILGTIGMQCMLLNSAINIFIYAAWFKDFRKAYKMMFRCKQNNEVSSFSRDEL